MAKKLKAKVNGVKVKDGEIVTLVVQVRARVREHTEFNGEKYKDVDFIVGDSESWVDAYDKKENGKFSVPGATIVKVKP